MYYNDYEDYMRSVLGYNNQDQNMYNMDYYMPNRMQGMMPTYQNECCNMKNEDNVEDLYPDIYKIVNPMVNRVCSRNNKPITNDLIEQMTMEVYNSMEADDINVVNINIETGDVNAEINRKSQENRDSKISTEKKEVRSSEEKRQRRPNNPLLRDLIRILILNRLFGINRPGNRPPMRPPFPGPGMPGRPPMPPMRPRFEQNGQEADFSNGMYGYNNNYYNY